jgi:hypothetical protein
MMRALLDDLKTSSAGRAQGEGLVSGFWFSGLETSNPETHFKSEVNLGYAD